MRAWLLAFLLATVLVAGCTGTTSTTTSGTATTSTMASTPMSLQSAAFPAGGPIPVHYTCDENQTRQPSPPLLVSNIPSRAVSVALTLVDHDVPTSLIATGVFRHWVVWNATPAAGSVVFNEDSLPMGATSGHNDAGKSGYLGPCPPVGNPAHHYNFTAYALDARPNLAANATVQDLEAWMPGHVVAQTTLIGTYARKVV